MWTDSTLQVVNDNQQYVGADGTTYPANFPKADIPGLFPVTLTSKPDEAAYSVSGFSIDETHTQVWASAPLAQVQLDAYAAAQIAAKQAVYTSALEAMYDAKAHERHYDTRFTCALRAGYAGPFQAEGTAFAIWMDDCNATAYGIMAQVLAGTLPYPTKAELLAMMPALAWPA